MANVVITGTSRGIGFELVKLMAHESHRVMALSRNDVPVRKLNLPNVTAIAFDMSSKGHLENLDKLLETQFTTIDILIHNAGALINKPFMETTVADFQSVYEVNVFGLAEITRILLPRMKNDGHVVSITSMGGVQGSAKFAGLAAYSSSKAAVITLTELWAEEFKDNGPSFNALALGAVQTEMLNAAFPGYKAPVTALQMAEFIKEFAFTGHRFFNGKVLPVSSSTP